MGNVFVMILVMIVVAVMIVMILGDNINRKRKQRDENCNKVLQSQSPYLSPASARELRADYITGESGCSHDLRLPQKLVSGKVKPSTRRNGVSGGKYERAG
jgi:hypothetical protein